MFYVISFVVLALSFFWGVFGFAQITGSVRCWRIRGIGATLFTVTLWVVLLLAGFFAVRRFLPDYAWSLYVAYAIGFIATLGTGKNGVE